VAKLRFVAGGSRASETMPAGMHFVKCIEAKTNQRGRGTQVMLTFQVAELAWNDGVELKQWYNLPASGRISPHTKYARAWELAANREIQVGDNMDPQIFVGKLFRAYVGYRSNGSGNDYDKTYTETKKDDGDFLRVHMLEELIINEKETTHMAPYDATNTNTNTNTSISTGVGGGGGGERSISTNTNTKNEHP
jgi:hypothetical protein